MTYGSLIQDLKKVQEVYTHGRGGTEYNWEKRLADLISSINEYLLGRIEMIAMYPTHTEMGLTQYHYSSTAASKNDKIDVMIITIEIVPSFT